MQIWNLGHIVEERKHQTVELLRGCPTGRRPLPAVPAQLPSVHCCVRVLPQERFLSVKNIGFAVGIAKINGWLNCLLDPLKSFLRFLLV